ncbi:hypothetical protein G8T81_15000, partial [Clostridium botulinum C/D]|nr:hypothetical protein [Clostridium botulinum C/D]
LCTHNVTSQSLWFWIILSIGLVGIDINAFHIMKSTKKKAFFIGQTVNALLGITILIQVLVYM